MNCWDFPSNFPGMFSTSNFPATYPLTLCYTELWFSEKVYFVNEYWISLSYDLNIKYLQKADWYSLNLWLVGVPGSLRWIGPAGESRWLRIVFGSIWSSVHSSPSPSSAHKKWKSACMTVWHCQDLLRMTWNQATMADLRSKVKDLF